MSTMLTLRLEEGRPLTNAEVDANFTSLRDNKLELSGGTLTGTLTLAGGSTIAAPLRFNGSASALLSAIVKGAMEYDSSTGKLYFTPLSERKEIAFVDSKTAGWTTPRTITLTGDVTGEVTGVDGTANISIATQVAANSVALGTDTTGSYVASLAAGTGVDIAGAAGEGASHTISIGQDVSISSDVQFRSVGVGKAAPAISGRIEATQDVVAYASSDERFKINVAPITNALQKTKAINGVQFTWNPELLEVHGYEGIDVGVIAQEVEQVLPEVVSTREDGFKAVKYEKVIALLIEAIKELDAKVSKCTCNR
jgi:hypothetical protein